MHEQTCSGPMPLRIADLPLADRIGGGSGSNKGVRKECAAAGAIGWLPTASAFSAENANRSQAGSSDGGDIQNINGGAKQNKDTSKRMLAGKNNESTSLTQRHSSGGVVPQGETSKPTEKPKPSSVGGTKQSKAPDATVFAKAPTSTSSTDGTEYATKKDMEWTTVWTCDICHDRQFDCFEDAVGHEKICKGPTKGKKKPQDKSPAAGKNIPSKGAVAALPKSPSPTKAPRSTSPKLPPKSPGSKSITLFSPILKDGSDSTNFTQISKYHRIILKSLRLLHADTTLGDGAGPISFKCQFCSHTFRRPQNATSSSSSWTLKEISQLLPFMVTTHISSSCKSCPPYEKTQLPIAKTSGRMPFGDFLALFFSENGIMEKTADGKGVFVLPDEDFKKIPGSEKSKRGRQIGVKKKRGRPAVKAAASKRQKGSKPLDQPIRSKHKEIKYGDMGCKMHNEEGAQFCLGPLDGLPFLGSFTREEAKKLHPSEKFVLQQLELFTMSPDLMKSANMNGPPQSVGLRCRNSIVDTNGCCFMKLSSVSNIARDVLLMAKEHLVSYRLMKAKDVKLVNEFLKRSEEHGGPLAHGYCNVIAKLYCLEVSKTDKSSVVWGESPKVTGEYSCPAEVDLSFVLGKSMPDLEVESPSPPSKAEVKVAQVATPYPPKDAQDPEKSTSVPAPTMEKPIPASTEKPSPDPSMNMEKLAPIPSSNIEECASAPPPKNDSTAEISGLTHYHYLVLKKVVIVPSLRMIGATDEGGASSSESTAIGCSFKCGNKIIGTPESLEQMKAILLDLPSHVESCSEITQAEKEELMMCKNAFSVTSEDQEGVTRPNTVGVDRYVEYTMELCINAYGMVSVHDPINGNYVGFSNVDELKANYGKKEHVETMFTLPMIKSFLLV